MKKPKNILVNRHCDIKICDFGLSRAIFEDVHNKFLTEYIATRWYRPPEVLLEWDSYNKAIDIWSIGCIFAELLDGKTLFPGKSSDEQIELIVALLGTPKIDDIYNKHGRFNFREKIYKYGKITGIPLSQLFPKVNSDALDLLDRMLKFEPDKRITVDEALKHVYFKDMPYEEEEKGDIVCKFDFEFDDMDLNTQELRDHILYEIMLYHDQKLLDDYEYIKDCYKKGIKIIDKKKLTKSGSKSSKGNRSSN